jgi:1,4-dihydroxy-2-naphthoyl-CoA hydrolase
MELTLAQLHEMGSSGFPGLLGIDVYEAGDGFVRARLELHDKHQAPNGYLHAGEVIGLADTAAGYGCILGRTTQVWDAAVTDPDGRTMALLRATQLILR